MVEKFSKKDVKNNHFNARMAFRKNSIKKLSRFFRRLLAFIMAYGTKICMKLILRTCSLEMHGLEGFVKSAAHSACILVLWQ